MTVDELEIKFDDAFDKNTSATGGGYEADSTYKGGLWESLLPSINQFAKEQSIAFARFIHEEEWVSSVDGDSDEKWWFKEDADDSYLTTDQLFQLFIENKTKQAV